MEEEWYRHGKEQIKSPRAETSVAWLRIVRVTTGLKWSVQRIKRNRKAVMWESLKNFL